MIAFIPARKGSKRIKNKNIMKLDNHPLLAYSINSALLSNMFTKVFCITDSSKYQKIANYYGADDFPLRPKNLSGSKSPDSSWVSWAIKICKKKKIEFDDFAILRPTSPFRNKDTIKRAVKEFYKKKANSLRAVELSKTHPGKIWKYQKPYIYPILNKKINNVPWHSSQYASLPKFYSQNASLEICNKKKFITENLIANKKIIPFFTNNIEGLDINDDVDIIKVNFFLKKNKNIIFKKSWFNVN